MVQAARQEAERLLDASGRQAGFAGAAAQAFCNIAFRGDRTCWMKPDQTGWPALRTATDAVLALQSGTATGPVPGRSCHCMAAVKFQLQAACNTMRGVEIEEQGVEGHVAGA